MFDSLDSIQKVFSILQSGTVIGAAIIAGYKLRLYRGWQATQKSEMVCTARATASNDFVFEAEYKISNTGDRPLQIQHVVLKLCGAKQVNGSHWMPNEDVLLVTPTVIGKDEKEAEHLANKRISPLNESPKPTDKNPPTYTEAKVHFKPIGNLGDVNKGTYSTFTLRCSLNNLPDVAFVLGAFSWKVGVKTFREKTFSEMWVNEVSASPKARGTAATA